MRNARWIVLSLVCATLLLGPGWASGFRAANPAEAPFGVVQLDKGGDLKNPDEFNALLKQWAEKEKPTHVFLMAHGWNNNVERATRSYRLMVKEMQAQADARGLRSPDFRPAYLGVHWPSLAFDGDEKLIETALMQLPGETQAAIKAVLRFTSFRNQSLEKMLDTDLKDKKWVTTLFRIVRPVLEKKLGLDRDDDFDLNALDRKDVETLLKAARVFSYWHIKKRSGVVGSSGGRKVLEEVQKALPPDVKVHLVGHSFGCKFWLSALVERSKEDRPVDSLVLLDGALSALAFSKEIVIKGEVVAGGYHAVKAKGLVRGPIVAVFNKNDKPVRYTYPLGSRAAGQVGEQPVRSHFEDEEKYRGMGAWGIDGVDSRDLLGLEEVKAGKRYDFKAGELHSIDGTKFLPNHDDIETPEVAWLIWSAALRK
jgi:pimeloyl-ACP methyl ester carboxylesterase